MSNVIISILYALYGYIGYIQYVFCVSSEAKEGDAETGSAITSPLLVQCTCRLLFPSELWKRAFDVVSFCVFKLYQDPVHDVLSLNNFQ